MSLVSGVIVLFHFSAPSNHENELIWYWTVVQGITTSDLSLKSLFRGEVDSKAGLIISPEVGHNRRKMCFKYYCTVIFLLFFFSTFWRKLKPFLWCWLNTTTKGYVRSRNGIRYLELSQILKVKYIMVVQNFSPVKRNIASRVRSFFFYLC